jgi:topoisomerase-4 subunit A
VRDTFGPKTPLGKRRTQFADAPEHDLAAIEEALIEREPITVVVSDKGWVPRSRDMSRICRTSRSRTDDSMGFSFFAESTSSSRCSPATDRFYTLDAQKLPGGRGHGVRSA